MAAAKDDGSKTILKEKEVQTVSVKYTGSRDDLKCSGGKLSKVYDFTGKTRTQKMPADEAEWLVSRNFRVFEMK